MLNAQQTQTVPAVPIAMKKAQQNVAGSMGNNPGAPGPIANPPKESKLKKPKKKFPFKYIISGILLLFVLIGAGAGFYLSQQDQDVRQQAAGSGEIYCGGCLNRNMPAQDTDGTWMRCNDWIDRECQVAGCAGEGTSWANQQCCAPLNKCANGRCGQSCPLDNNDICGGIREGSNCNNGGRWSCDGGGKCIGGVWNQPAPTTTTTTQNPRQLCMAEKGGNTAYNTAVKNCTDNSGDWNNTQCKCIGATVPTTTEPAIGGSSCRDKLNQEYPDAVAETGSSNYDGQKNNCSGTWNDALCDCITSTNTAPSICRDKLNQEYPDAVAETGFSNYDGQKNNCSGTWNDSICDCSDGFISQSCTNGEPVRCENEVRYQCMDEEWIVSGTCLEGSTGIAATGGNCTEGEPVQCVQGDNYECLDGEWYKTGARCEEEVERGARAICIEQKGSFSNYLEESNNCNGDWNDESCRCFSSTTQTTFTNATRTNDAGGTGSCSACIGLGGGQAERDCYANCSGLIQTGICAGMTADQCTQACNSTSGATTQICSGSQEAAGSARAGEFISCGASSTSGCGQVDCIVNGELIGFVIDNASCTTTDVVTTTTTTTTTTQSTPRPTPVVELAVCNESCSTNTDCAQSDHSCEGGVCRLTTNPESVTCTAVGCGEPCTVSTDCVEAGHICLESADDGNPDGGICRLIENPNSLTCSPTVACNEYCTQDTDCAETNHSCDTTTSTCRLTTNPGDINCVEAVEPSPTPTVGCNDACVTSSDCSDTNHSCNSGTGTCRLTENPGDINCAPAEVVPTPAPGCNEECFASSECSNSSAVCYDNLCRLSTNPVDTSCQPKQVIQTTGQFYQQPELPQALPESGSEDILNWLKVGLGALGLGLVFLFL